MKEGRLGVMRASRGSEWQEKKGGKKSLTVWEKEKIYRLTSSFQINLYQGGARKRRGGVPTRIRKMED